MLRPIPPKPRLYCDYCGPINGENSHSFICKIMRKIFADIDNLFKKC